CSTPARCRSPASKSRWNGEKAPPLQGRGWGGACAVQARHPPPPDPLPCRGVGGMKLTRRTALAGLGGTLALLGTGCRGALADTADSPFIRREGTHLLRGADPPRL